MQYKCGRRPVQGRVGFRVTRALLRQSGLVPRNRRGKWPSESPGCQEKERSKELKALSVSWYGGEQVRSFDREWFAPRETEVLGCNGSSA